MSDVWATVVAALGSAFLTGGFSIGVFLWSDHNTRKAARAEQRARAYAAMIAQSSAIAHFASDLHLLMQTQTGMKAGLNKLLGVEQPLGMLGLTDRARTLIQPMYEAWAEVGVFGSQDAISASNTLINLSVKVVSVATQRGEAGNALLRGIMGEQWTQEQLDQWQAELERLAEARRHFNAIARKEAGIEEADLFTQPPKPPTTPTTRQPQ